MFSSLRVRRCKRLPNRNGHTDRLLGRCVDHDMHLRDDEANLAVDASAKLQRETRVADFFAAQLNDKTLTHAGGGAKITSRVHDRCDLDFAADHAVKPEIRGCEELSEARVCDFKRPSHEDCAACIHHVEVEEEFVGMERGLRDHGDHGDQGIIQRILQRTASQGRA